MPDPPVNDNLRDEHLFSINLDDPWYGDILTYLQTHKFAPHLTHDDRQCIRHQAPRYLLISDDLYHCGVDIIPRHCITHVESDKVLNACHGGACGGHLFGMAIAQKIMYVRYFWPSLFSDCIEAIKHYHNYQLYAPKARDPPSPLHLIFAADPFCKWDIDFKECQPPSSNNDKYIIVVVNYFTKWVKAMPTFNNTIATAALFFFNHVIA